MTPTNTIDTVVSEVILRKAYKRLGIDVVIKKYPAERALNMADSGAVDGEVQRIDGISKKYTNLLQVRPAINFIEGAVFTKGTVFPVTGWQSLKPYRIGIVRGIKFAERNTEGMRALPARDYANLMIMLDRRRVDVVVSPGFNGWYQIKQQGLAGIEILEPPLARFDLYHYLHKKRAPLVPKIEAVLTAMADAGELGAIRDRVIDVLLRRAVSKLPVCDDDYACFD